MIKMQSLLIWGLVMKRFCLINLVIWILLSTACTDTDTNQSTIDQKYLESKQYTEFKNRSLHETQQKTRNDVSLHSLLQQFGNCADVELKSLPVEFDADQVQHLLETATDLCSIETDTRKIRLIAESFSSGYTLRWILVAQKTAYQDQELIAATFSDGELRSFTTVGVFKKNLSERITSNIRVQSQDGGTLIISTTDRDITYPIEQANTIESEYIINEAGNITKQQ